MCSLSFFMLAGRVSVFFPKNTAQRVRLRLTFEPYNVYSFPSAHYWNLIDIVQLITSKCVRNDILLQSLDSRTIVCYNYKV